MSEIQLDSGARRVDFDWRKDLEASRTLVWREVDAYGYILSWIEKWRMERGLPPGREAMEAWWRELREKEGSTGLATEAVGGGYRLVSRLAGAF